MEAIHAIGFGFVCGCIVGLAAFVWRSRPRQDEPLPRIREIAEEREASLAAARADRAELDRILAAAKLEAPQWVFGGIAGDRRLAAGWRSQDGKRTAYVRVQDLEAELVTCTEPINKENVERFTICDALLPALAGMVRDHLAKGSV